MWNGTLYFMLDSYNKYKITEGKEGDIYAYCPADGTVTKVYEAGALLGVFAQRLCCDDKGVYFSAGSTEIG